MSIVHRDSFVRSRWSAVGAIVALALGAGGFGALRASGAGADASVMTPITPCRLLDSRTLVGTADWPVGPDQTRTITAVGKCGIGADATGLSLNVTSVDATAPTFFTLFPTLGPLPNASHLNPGPDRAVTSNGVDVKLSADGRFDLYNHAGSSSVVIDVLGIFTPGAGSPGPQGIPGTPGATGPTGAVGATGPTGADGATGPTGADGATGPTGADGAIGPAGQIGPAGSAGPAGPIGPAGSAGQAGPAGQVGPVGPQGPIGPTGARGPVGPSGSGLALYDGNNVRLGTVVYFGDEPESITILTSTGHHMSLRWDGTMRPEQIYYAGAGCTGQALLNSGGSGDPIYGKTVVFSGSQNTLMTQQSVNANGASPHTSMSALTIDNPTCGASVGTRNGWLLQATTAATVGLPSYPLVPPLTIQ